MSEIEKMQKYIERTKIKDAGNTYTMLCKDIVALLNEENQSDAILLAFDYGRAKGYRAAKAEGKRVMR